MPSGNYNVRNRTIKCKLAHFLVDLEYIKTGDSYYGGKSWKNPGSR